MIVPRKPKREAPSPATGALVCAVGILSFGSLACSSGAALLPDASGARVSPSPSADGEGGAIGSPGSGGGSDSATGTSGSSSGTGAIGNTGSGMGSSSGDSGTVGNIASSGREGGVDGSPTSAADGGNVAPCAASHYLICEDFESTLAGAIPNGWVPQGDVAVATDDAYKSARSLKLSVVAGKTENYRGISVVPSQLGPGHWGRIHYKVQAPAPKYFAHDTFVSLTGNGPDNGFQNENVRVVDTVQESTNMHQFLYNVQPSGPEFGKGSTYAYTFADGGWHCAEWHIDNPTQSYHFYYDGVEVPDIAITNGPGKNTSSEIPAAFTKLTVGISQYQSPPQGFAMQPVWFTAWIDDVALDANRIGCQ